MAMPVQQRFFLRQGLEFQLQATGIGFPRDEFLEQHGGEIEAVLTSGMVGLSADEIALMPKLKVVQTFAVGYETVDTAAAKARAAAAPKA